MRKIGYNYQTDNIIALGIRGSSQCFSTCDWMFLSYYCQLYKVNDDPMIKQYIEALGKEDVNKIFEWEAHRMQIQKWLFVQNVPGLMKQELISKDKLKELLKTRPVIIGTKKMAGLPGGHIILGVDVDGDNIICNDPYGNALTNYKSKNGENVQYVFEMFDSGKNIRGMWLE